MRKCLQFTVFFAVGIMLSAHADKISITKDDTSPTKTDIPETVTSGPATISSNATIVTNGPMTISCPNLPAGTYSNYQPMQVNGFLWEVAQFSSDNTSAHADGDTWNLAEDITWPSSQGNTRDNKYYYSTTWGTNNLPLCVYSTMINGYKVSINLFIPQPIAPGQFVCNEQGDRGFCKNNAFVFLPSQT